jgi:hypothetical protein
MIRREWSDGQFIASCSTYISIRFGNFDSLTRGDHREIKFNAYDMDEQTLVLSFVGMSCCACALSGLIFLNNRNKGTTTSSQAYTNLKGAPLPVPILEKGKAPWNISWIGNPENVSVSNDEFIVKIKKGLHGSDSGGAFRANPNNKLPADAVTVSYEVFFPSTLQWVKGGKLPGVCFGTANGECSTGGDWRGDSGSFRVMFREEGLAIGYSYLAIDGGSQGALNAQGSGYKDVVVSTGRTGHDLWKKKNAGLRFKKGVWNTVTMELRMNTPGKRDGLISLTVNGANRTIKDTMFRQDARVKFNNVLIVSFFGGGSDDWNSPNDTMIKFRNFRFDAAR